MKEELVGPFNLPGIPEESKFSEANLIIGNLQMPSSTELAHFSLKEKPKKDSTTETAKKNVADSPQKNPLPTKRGEDF